MVADCMNSQSGAPHVSLGQQILDKHAKFAAHETIDLGEIGQSMHPDIHKSLMKVVKMHENLTEDWYITEIFQHDPFLEGVLKAIHTARRTRPNPEWGLGLYKVHASSGHVTYEWGLPHVEEAILAMKDPEGWDKKLIKDIMAFAKGELV